jgi:hypothetical protein
MWRRRRRRGRLRKIEALTPISTAPASVVENAGRGETHVLLMRKVDALSI